MERLKWSSDGMTAIGSGVTYTLHETNGDWYAEWKSEDGSYVLDWVDSKAGAKSLVEGRYESGEWQMRSMRTPADPAQVAVEKGATDR